MHLLRNDIVAHPETLENRYVSFFANCIVFIQNKIVLPQKPLGNGSGNTNDKIQLLICNCIIFIQNKIVFYRYQK